MDQWNKQKVFNDEIQMANKPEKMFNITSHQRNTNPNYTGILSHLSQKGSHQWNKWLQMLERVDVDNWASLYTDNGRMGM